MSTVSNPDLTAQQFIANLLQGRSFEFPDGGVLTLNQVDCGFASRPTGPLYASVHSVSSRATVTRLGKGAGMAARSFEVDILISIEYEDLEPTQGNARLTQLRWDVLKLLAENARSVPGFELAEFDEATIQALSSDDGGYEDWGYIGQVLIPVTVRMSYAPTS